jgi:hypothetical protein
MQMSDDKKPSECMTSQELDESIRKHREHVKRLIDDAKLRRSKAENLRDCLDQSLQKNHQL